MKRIVVCLLALTIAATASVADRTDVKSTEQKKLPCHPVKGTVLFQGKPLSGAMVVFHGEKPDKQILRATGVSDKEGKFTLTTFDKGDGAPSGTYAVTVVCPVTKPDEIKDPKDPKPIVDVLGGRYNDFNKSPLTVTVKRGPNEINLELK